MSEESNFVRDTAAVPDVERTGFCQDCGRSLTTTTMRTVGSGVFCEPCLERRVAAGTATSTAGSNYAQSYAAQGNAAAGAGSAAQPGWQNGGYPPPPPVPPPPGTVYTGIPTPWLAALLGFIPGVGAMYNGQFAKGVVHMIIFAVLVSLSRNVADIFGLFVTGWIFYMAFEAYHTAKARRDGYPLPDPFGLNNVGERLGFGKNWPGSFTSGPTPGSGTGQTWQPVTPPPPQPTHDWVGYVPPTNYEAAPGAVPPMPPVTPYAGAPYTEAVAASASVSSSGYAAPAYAPVTSGVPVDQDQAFAVPSARRFPAGAMWLIGLGVLFLLGNIDPDLRFSWRWLLPVVLAGLAVWLLYRRWSVYRANVNASRAYEGFVCSVRFPAMLLTLAILTALQDAHVLTLGQTWPVLLVVFGGLLLLERMVGKTAHYPAAAIPMDASAPVSPTWGVASDAGKGGQ